MIHTARMENTGTYAQALAAGFINQLGMASQPYYYSSATLDPYYQSGGQGASLNSTAVSLMTNYTTIYSTTLSMWQAAELITMCNIDSLKYGSSVGCFPPPALGSGCAGDNDHAWLIFRGMYLSMKMQNENQTTLAYVTAPVNSCNPDDTCIGKPDCGIYANKQPRNITFQYAASAVNFMPNGTSKDSAQAFFNRQLTAQCDSQCVAYAYDWFKELSVCATYATLHADSATLISHLVAVCEAGCNANHPLGASTTPNYAPDIYGEYSFGDVIRNVLGVSTVDTACDSLAINMPPPYNDSTGLAGAPIAYYRPTTCICGKLDTLLALYYLPDSLSGDTAYKNFADYLNKKFGGNMTESTVYGLINLCQDTGCFFAQNPIQLPIWLTCCNSPTTLKSFTVYNTSHVLVWDTNVNITTEGCCIRCSDIEAGMRIFQEESPPGTDTLPNYQTLLTNFLNDLYNFNLTYSQYIAFDTSCGKILCSVTVTYYEDVTGVLAPITDSTCGGVTIIDTFVSYSSIPISRTVTGAKADSLAPYLCNEPQTQPPITPQPNNCVYQLTMDAQANAQNAYNQYMDSITNAFEANYISHCMNIDDSFHATIPFDQYHYTLYYYDQAGNLAKTVPPQGVNPITSPVLLNQVSCYRAGSCTSPVYPVDSMESRYWYNTLNAPLQQVSPDADTVHFWYDRLGRIVLSQNGVQKPYLFTFTKYDALGRIIQTGQLSTMPPSPYYYPPLAVYYFLLDVLPGITQNDFSLKHFIAYTTHNQITHTYYDSIIFKDIPLKQLNLRNRISSITYSSIDDRIIPCWPCFKCPPCTKPPVLIDTIYENAIHFSLDIEGNAQTVLNENKNEIPVAQRFKRIDYNYDLVSGKVNEVYYQRDSADQFLEQYEYDADNRITNVLTSCDSIYWENDAAYEYYSHEPLAREVIGRRQVQGVDYAYTINGWIKGVNSSILNPDYDMGQDGDVHNLATATIGRDAMGFTLEYFAGDYVPIGASQFEAQGLPVNSLFNGNISGATYSIKPLLPKTMGYAYQYDQLNRIRAMQAYDTPDTIHDNWSTATPIQDFREAVNYDENGNITTYLRHGNTIAGMPLGLDSLTYHYNKGTNQLNWVHDTIPAINYPTDIDNEKPNTYSYNKNGELARDRSAEDKEKIAWLINGKPRKIVKKVNGYVTIRDSIVFEYDPLGNRIEKRYYHHNLPDTVDLIADTTLYARDAQGNILSVYDRKLDTVRVKEWDIYGSKRIGIIDTSLIVYAPPTALSYTITSAPPDTLITYDTTSIPDSTYAFVDSSSVKDTAVTSALTYASATSIILPLSFDSSTTQYYEGQKRYELTNHLGNVLVTVSDKKNAVDTTTIPNIAQYYMPEIINAQDFYPFGMVEPGRQYAILRDSAYKFTFNGKLHDDEIYGKDNSYDYGMRFYDPRIGRFPSVDPLRQKFPMLSAYQYASNSPIQYIDIDGEEGGPPQQNANGTTTNPQDNTYTPPPLYSIPLTRPLDPPSYFSSDNRSQAVMDIDQKRTDILSGTGSAYNTFVKSFHDLDVKYNPIAQINEGMHGLMFGTDTWYGAPMSQGQANDDLFKGTLGLGFLAAPEFLSLGADGSVWSLPPVQRGFAVEKMLGGNLPSNFPVVDKFADGVATSIKSVDLSLSSYQNPKALYSTLSGYVDKLVGFTQQRWGGAVVENVTSKELLIAIPKGATSDQVMTLSQIIEYGKQEGINVSIQTIK